MVGDTLQVFGFGPVADVRVDVPAIALMLPNATWHCGAFVFADKVVTITMLDVYGRDALQANLSESIDKGVDGLAMPDDGTIREGTFMPFVTFSICFVGA